MVAKGLLDSIIAESEKQNARPIKAKMSCGTFNSVNDEVLLFAFEAIAKGTICEGLKLEIEHKNIQGRCKQCSKEFDFVIVDPKCGHCGCNKFDLLPDPGLILEEIELEKN
jgi:hydrogenase nickel incorporation protein HypA/HybF